MHLILLFLVAGLEIIFYSQGVQLHSQKLLKGAVCRIRNQHIFRLPDEIWGSHRRIQGSPGILTPANFKPWVGTFKSLNMVLTLKALIITWKMLRGIEILVAIRTTFQNYFQGDSEYHKYKSMKFEMLNFFDFAEFPYRL